MPSSRGPRRLTPAEREQLIAKARQGPAIALGELFDAYRAYLKDLARRQLDQDLKAKASPSDLVQETLLRAQQAFPRFRSDTDSAMRAWLGKLLRDNVNDLRRRYKRSRKRAVAKECSIDGSEARDQIDRHARRDVHALVTSLERNELRALLQELVDELSDVYRKVIQWRYVDRLSHLAIGDKVGRSEEAARKLCERATAELAKAIKRRGL